MSNVACRRTAAYCVLLLGGSSAALPAFSAAAPNDYRLHAGDKLEVSVWKETELQKPGVMVRPDGKFTFPLVGEVPAVGRTVSDVRQEVEDRLKKYIPDPVVTVGVVDVSGNVAYVIGQVNKPGAYVMNPAINVLQALSIAGGTNAFAKLDGIVILRGSQAAQRALPFRYSQVSAGKDLDQNVTLESGDVVVVP